MKSYLKPKDAFTFLEILAALVILSLALIPILTWVPMSIQTKLKAERKTISIFLAQGKIEELHSAIINNFNFNYTPSGAFNSPYQDHRYLITDNFNSNIKTISIKVWHIEKPEDETIFYTQLAKR